MISLFKCCCCKALWDSHHGCHLVSVRTVPRGPWSGSDTSPRNIQPACQQAGAWLQAAARWGCGYRLQIDRGVAWIYAVYNQGASLQAADRQGAWLHAAARQGAGHRPHRAAVWQHETASSQTDSQTLSQFDEETLTEEQTKRCIVGKSTHPEVKWFVVQVN